MGAQPFEPARCMAEPFLVCIIQIRLLLYLNFVAGGGEACVNHALPSKHDVVSDRNKRVNTEYDTWYSIQFVIVYGGSHNSTYIYYVPRMWNGVEIPRRKKEVEYYYWKCSHLIKCSTRRPTDPTATAPSTTTEGFSHIPRRQEGNDAEGRSC